MELVTEIEASDVVSRLKELETKFAELENLENKNLKMEKMQPSRKISKVDENHLSFLWGYELGYQI